MLRRGGVRVSTRSRRVGFGVIRGRSHSSRKLGGSASGRHSFATVLLPSSCTFVVVVKASGLFVVVVVVGVVVVAVVVSRLALVDCGSVVARVRADDAVAGAQRRAVLEGCARNTFTLQMKRFSSHLDVHVQFSSTMSALSKISSSRSFPQNASFPLIICTHPESLM